MAPLLGFDEARDRLLGLARPLGTERAALDAADGRVIRETVLAHVDSPPADTSAMDGYAVATADLTHAPYTLPVVGMARPGALLERLAPGTACRIFTGAELPLGADAIVLQEDAREDAGRVTFDAAPSHGDHVRRRGEDLAVGATAVAEGTRLTPSKLGLLASLDRAWVTVSRRPRVAIIGTGDELRLPGTPHRPGTVAESGTLVVRALAARAGADAVVCPMVRDDPDALAAALRDALRATDLVVTVGGMSEGDFDLVRPTLSAVGATLTFFKVAIKPGKPLGVGEHPGGYFLGLPGNPAAAVVTFALFGVPFLRALAGDSRPIAPRRTARLATPVRQKPGRRTFLRATLESGDDDDLPRVRPLLHQSSGSIATVAHADVLAVVPETVSELPAGATVEVIAFE
ncbi:MAG: gephyrin-like molybdotransferase Glp [Polyangiaceae bacterium]